MEENTKNIIKKPSTIVAAMIAVLLSFGVGNVTHIGTDQGYLPYSCANENVEDMFCYKLSRVGTTGVNRNCYYDRDRSAKYKTCSAGWELMTSAIVTDSEDCPTCPKQQECALQKECPKQECEIKVCNQATTQVIAYMPDGTKQWCEGIGPGQKCRTTTDILSELG